MTVQSLRKSINRTGDVGANKFQTTIARTRGAMTLPEMLTFGKDGAVTEFGEVIGVIYKHQWQGHPLDLEKLKLEIGDLLWFLATICDATGLSLADVMAANQEKLAKRYPNGHFTPEDSIARVDEHEQAMDAAIKALVATPGPFDMEAELGLKDSNGKSSDPYTWESGE